MNKPFSVVDLKVSIRDLYIMDHALRSHLKRKNITEIEKKQENEIRDRVNDGIKAIRQRRGRAKMEV